MVGRSRCALLLKGFSSCLVGISFNGAETVNALPHWVPGLLITSTFIGFLGYLIQGFDILFVISGVIFGIGYIGVGFTVWLQPVR